MTALRVFFVMPLVISKYALVIFVRRQLLRDLCVAFFAGSRLRGCAIIVRKVLRTWHELQSGSLSFEIIVRRKLWVKLRRCL